MHSGVTRRAIEQTEARIRPHLRVTPVLQTDAAGFGGPPVALTLKLELLQHAGSFKARGAFANLRPVICYDRGAPPSLVVSGQTGLVVPADSIEGVADAVLALDTARLQLDKMSLAARRRAREIQDKALS